MSKGISFQRERRWLLALMVAVSLGLVTVQQWSEQLASLPPPAAVASGEQGGSGGGGG